MSSEYFGLVMDPFESGPDTRFLYMEPVRRNAFAQLLSSVYECRGLVLLACERGLGKSTLIRHLAEQLSALDSVLVLYPGGVLNCRPNMSFADILAACRGRFDRRHPSAGDEDRLLTTLERAAGRGQVAILMLDDADALDDQTLMRLRRLTDADRDERRLLSVILVGSQGLPRRLERPGTGESFADLVIELTPLRDRDVDRLVRHRLTVAGQGEGDLFSPVALAEVARRTRGNPMRINALCEAAMSLAEREAKSTVSRDLVERAAGLVEDTDDDLEPYSRGRRALTLPPSTEFQEPLTASPAPQPAPPPVSHSGETTRRLDDVAEAIRAADMRSVGGGDPHIKYAFSRDAPDASVAHPEPERDYGPRTERRFDPEAATPFVDEHRFYPGIRPSQPYRQRRRGWLATAALLGLILALIFAGGLYASRTGLFNIGDLVERAGVVVNKVVHLVSTAIRPDPVVEEGVDGEAIGAGSRDSASVTPPSIDSEDPQSTSLAFDRFGSPLSADETAQSEDEAVDAGEAAPVGTYEFAPPPPQESRPEATIERPAAPSPEPAAPAEQSPSPADVASAAIGEPTGDIGAGDAGDFLGAGTAAIISRAGLPETSKPTPPPPPQRPATDAPTLASPAPSATAVPESPPPPTRDSRQAQTEPLLARGDEYLLTADLDMARTFYQMAYERGSAEAAVRMGWTYDPQYFQRAGLRSEASPREAILWYQEARRRGSRQASERLSALATWLQSAAASGDQEAQRILRLWQG